MYTCGLLTLVYGRNQHSTIKQLSSNKKIKKKKKETNKDPKQATSFYALNERKNKFSPNLVRGNNIRTEIKDIENRKTKTNQNQELAF